jgi:tetratricopeptide (TPR) repeat protein
MSSSLAHPAGDAALPRKQKYVRAVGPRLRVLLYIVFSLVALLTANSLFLFSITALEWVTRATYQDYFYLYMFALHIALGLVLIVPFVAFGLIHMVTSWNRKNKRAIRIGYALLMAGIVVLVTGLLLMRIEGLFDLKHPVSRMTVYWLHVLVPVAAGWLYWLHRLAGPKIKWRIGITYATIVAALVGSMVILRTQDPRGWNRPGSVEGKKYFEPSLVTTNDGKFINEQTLMMDSYCLKCHQDAYKGWFHSAHHFSSFNNPPYLASVKETREVSLKRDGNVKASRWCAGCHDPVPFLSGKFDDPKYDLVNDPTAHAGITCTVCHAITHVNSTKGNADYVIEEPVHYPFATSKNPVLQYINNQLVKAKPSFHKQTFLKPFHKDPDKAAEFCSTCHKVALPKELNHYKEHLRGQDHFNPYLLSGVAHGAQSFYYPPKTQKKCAGCHMNLLPSGDFGARDFDNTGKLSIHNHLFLGANTAIAFLKKKIPEDETHAPYLGEVPEGFVPDFDSAMKAHQDFLKDCVRVDIFALRERKPGHEGEEHSLVSGTLHAPLRPVQPRLKPGEKYLLETVIRTLKLGHPLTQGTADSNEIWMDVTVKSGDKIIGRSGGLDAKGEVDRYAHFVNVFMLDRSGNRINRRNPQDIFTPLYNHQIPPGAGWTVHYELEIPAKEQLAGPITIEAKLQYRKFDQEYVDFFTRAAKAGDKPFPGFNPQRPANEPVVNKFPITTMAADKLTLPVLGFEAEVTNPPSPIKDEWQRWNDYGIGLLLEGKKGELRQAEEVFQKVAALGRYDGPLNLARLYQLEGRLDEAGEMLNTAAASTAEDLPIWTVNWLKGSVNAQQGHLEDAIRNYQSVLNDRTEIMLQRGYDFSQDFRVINDLAKTLFEQSKKLRGESQKAEQQRMRAEARDHYLRTLALDSEDVSAHFGLSLIYEALEEKELAEKHRALHERYKPDDNAGDKAIAIARGKYPHANAAAEAVVIYPLRRRGAPELPEEVAESAKTNTSGALPAGAAAVTNAP